MSKKGSPAAPVRMEAVEARQLLSAVVDHGVLNIQGTRRGDDILITFASPRTTQVVMNGEVFTFARRSIGKVKILGNDGSDYITFGQEFTGPAYISGGSGNDTVGSSSGADTLYGDDGDDQVYGNAGRDVLHGGAGNDTLGGGDDDDQLFGDANADNLSGDAGDDTLYGGRGGDTLYEDAGRDRLCGNADRDTFYFADSPKDVRDETGDEVIAAFAPPFSNMAFDPKSLVGVTGLGINAGSLIFGSMSSGIIANHGGSQGGLIMSGGVTANGGSIHIGGGNGSGDAPIIPTDPNTVTLAFGQLTYAFRDVPAGTTLFPMSGNFVLTSQRSLLDRLRAITVEGGGAVADGATLDVPADTVITSGAGTNGSTISSGSGTTLVGPLTLTLPSGNSLRINAEWTLTVRAAEVQV